MKPKMMLLCTLCALCLCACAGKTNSPDGSENNGSSAEKNNREETAFNSSESASNQQDASNPEGSTSDNKETSNQIIGQKRIYLASQEFIVHTTETKLYKLEGLDTSYYMIKYNEYGDPISYEEKLTDGTTNNYSVSYDYTWDIKGYMTKKSVKYSNGEKPDYEVSYKYYHEPADKLNKVIETNSLNDTEWVYEFDNGLLLSRYNYDGGRYYSYVNGKLSVQEYGLTDNSVRMQYHYGEFGELTQVRDYNDQYGGAENIHDIEYVYNRDGSINMVKHYLTHNASYSGVEDSHWLYFDQNQHVIKQETYDGKGNLMFEFNFAYAECVADKNIWNSAPDVYTCTALGGTVHMAD